MANYKFYGIKLLNRKIIISKFITYAFQKKHVFINLSFLRAK